MDEIEYEAQIEKPMRDNEEQEKEGRANDHLNPREDSEMLESEAKKKVCPVISTRHVSVLCKGTNCIAWKVRLEMRMAEASGGGSRKMATPVEPAPVEPAEGHCGMTPPDNA